MHCFIPLQLVHLSLKKDKVIRILSLLPPCALETLRQFVNLVKNKVDKALGTMLKYTKMDLSLVFCFVFLVFFFCLFNTIDIVQVPSEGLLTK